MTLDELHRLVHSWQPAWMQRLPQPVFEIGSALWLIPLLGAVWVLRLLWPVPYVAAPIVLIVASAVYEKVMSGPKVSDHIWRTVGILVLWWGVVLVVLA